MNENNRKRDAMINDILCDFDFEKVQAIMVLLDFKWRGQDGKDECHTPSVAEIIEVSCEILTKAYDKQKANHEYVCFEKCYMVAEAFIGDELRLSYQPFSASNHESYYNEDVKQ